jgi:hypothetical protein
VEAEGACARFSDGQLCFEGALARVERRDGIGGCGRGRRKARGASRGPCERVERRAEGTSRYAPRLI